MAIQYLNGINVSGTGEFGNATAYALKLKSSSGARGINIIDSNGVNRGGIDWSGSDFVIRNSTDSDLLKINYSSKQANFYGNVGIATTSPQYQLHSYNEIGTQTLRLGYGAGYARITTDDASKPLDFQISGSTKMSLNQYGNVGIGTTSPVGKLSVYRTDNTYAVNLSDARSRSSLYLKSAGNYDSELTFSSGQSNVQLIQAVNSAATTGRNIAINPFGGSVGIGTTSPDKELEVSGDIKISGGDYNGLFFENASGTTKTLLYQHASYDALVIKDIVNNADRVTFENSGNVGIGTTSPSGLLHVSSGTANEDCVVIIESDTDNNDETSNPRLELRQDGGGVIGRLGYRNNTNSLELINQTAEPLYLGTSNSTDLTILSGGNVGIGTTSPHSKLHVEGDGVAIANGTNTKTTLIPSGGGNSELTFKGQNYQHYVNYETSWNSFRYARLQSSYNTSDAQFFLYKSNGTGGTAATTKISTGNSNFAGNVGIGASSPGAKLHVVGDARFGDNGGVSLTDDSVRSYVRARFNHLDLGTTRDTDDIYFSTGTTTTTKMVIKSGGNVGIGTTSPSTALDVVGSATATNFYVGSSGTMQLFDYSGNLHIYSTSGTDILLGGGVGSRQNDVTIGNGNLNVVGKITADNFLSVQGVDPGNPSATSEELRLSGYGILGNRSAMYITNGHSTGTLRFGIGGSGVGGGVKMLLNSDGELGINTTTPGSKLDIFSATTTTASNLLRLRTSFNGTNPEKVAGFYVNTNTERGFIAVNQYAVTYSTSSDYRLKENIVPISNGIERLKELKPCRFNFIEGGPNYVVDGFIAHEAAKVVPEAVTGEKDAVDENNEPTYQGIDQSKIVPLLTAALKEAIKKIEQLENRIQTLENN